MKSLQESLFDNDLVSKEIPDFRSIYKLDRIENVSDIQLGTDSQFFDAIDNYYIKNDYYLFIHKNDIDKISLEYHFISKDDGYILVLLDNQKIHKEKLYLNKEKISWFRKIWYTIFEKRFIWKDYKK